MNRATGETLKLHSKWDVLTVPTSDLLRDSLKLIVQPASQDTLHALWEVGFQEIPTVSQLAYREIVRSQVSELFLQLSRRLSRSERTQSRFILTRSDLESNQFLIEFLNARPLSDMTLMIENAWFLQVLAKQGLFFHYQPIFDLTSGRVIAHECLARAKGEQGEQFSGQQLIDAALSMNLTQEFDRLARSICLQSLAQLCGEMNWLDGQPMFFINLIPNAIAQDPKSLELNFQQVLDFGLRPEQIVFELTEIEALGQNSNLPNLIDRIRAWGFGLALDDLGSNVALDHYCTEFRPDIIKLDRRLVHGCSHFALKQVMIKSLLQFAHELGIAVLAEGLEAREDIEFCQEIGIDLGQGFGLGGPETMPWRNFPQAGNWATSRAS
jgi:EAL domain-containing protein (putative c-di-GMP-specific phosphodiesterase class I)